MLPGSPAIHAVLSGSAGLCGENGLTNFGNACSCVVRCEPVHMLYGWLPFGNMPGVTPSVLAQQQMGSEAAGAAHDVCVG